MRNAFVDGIFNLANNDDKIILLVGDLGYKIFDNFKFKFPNRFYNVGIAEANMVSMASGLALQGYKPFIYSIVPFITLRCYEQIRNDLCYNYKNVVVVGVGGGYTYGHNGATHHGIEDIAVMRALPKMRVLCPGDPVETALLMKNITSHEGPTYIRLGRAGEEVVYSTPPNIEMGKIFHLEKGKDITVFSTGNMLPLAKKTFDYMNKKNISCGLVSVHTIKPLDIDGIKNVCQNTKCVVTLEEHNIIGGLGSALSEILAESKIHVAFKRIGINDEYASVSGDQEYLRKINNIDIDSIIKEIEKLI